MYARISCYVRIEFLNLIMSNTLRARLLRTSYARYTAPFVIIAGSLFVRLLVQRWLGVSVPYLHFFPAVMIAAWFGGFGPGLVATLLAAAAAIYFSVWPGLITLTGA